MWVPSRCCWLVSLRWCKPISKRVLAYSTMSQIGYMFLALGVQAWDAAIFHLMTHAFFKALLFLSSGSVILACHHEQNIFKMGGLRKNHSAGVCLFPGGRRRAVGVADGSPPASSVRMKFWPVPGPTVTLIW
ncbi:hypothetical protein CVE36_25385 [Pseudomonas syringae pv. actinidiae]|nr:hypothetical protein [Pseudomonas syringae pv. actinidiae]